MANPAALHAVTAARKAQTHCLRGHEYTEENTRLRPNGCRACKQCNRDRMMRNWRRDQKAKDGIVDEVAIERASRGDVEVYEALTKKEHKVLVKMLADGPRREIPIRRLRDAVQSELARREKRNGLVG